MAIPGGIFMAPPATPQVRLIESDPFTAGFQTEDKRQREIAEHEMRMAAAAQNLRSGEQRMEVTAWDLAERQRKAQEALDLDAALRRAFRPGDSMAMDPVTMGGGEDTTIRGPSSASGSYTTQELPPAGPAAPASAPASAGGAYDPALLVPQTIRTESGGVVDARPIDPATGRPLSSAAGPGQFIDRTWLSVLPEAARRIGLDVNGMTREQQLALRTDRNVATRLAEEAIKVYAEENIRTMGPRLGRDVTTDDARLAHFLGAEGAVKFLQADPDELAEVVAGPDATRANRRVLGNGRRVRDVINDYRVTPGARQAAGAPAAAPGEAMGGGGGSRPDESVMPVYGRPSAGGGMFDGDPRMRRAQEGLANTPGGGAALFKMAEGERSGMQAAKMKVFELAGSGKAEAAIMLAREIGLRINPAMLRDEAAANQIWTLLRTTAGQDPAHAMEVIRNLKPGGSVQQAVTATRDPIPRTYGRGAAGDKPIIRSVPGKGLYRIDPATGQADLVVPVGDQASAYKMQARARDLAVREANSMLIPPGSQWIDRRAAEIFSEFQVASQPTGSAAASPSLDAGGIPPQAVPMAPSIAPASPSLDAGGIPPQAVPMAPSIAPASPSLDAGGIPPQAVPMAPSIAPAAPPPTVPGQMVPGGAAGVGPGDIFQQAQDAIRRGASPEDVRRRGMEQYGVDVLGGASAPAAPMAPPMPLDSSPFGKTMP